MNTGLCVLVASREEYGSRSLLRLRRSGAQEGDPIVAFASEQLGKRWITAWSKPDDFLLLNTRDLPSGLLAEAQKTAVLVFSSDQEIDAYFQDRLGYSQNAELVDLSTAELAAATANGG